MKQKISKGLDKAQLNWDRIRKLSLSRLTGNHPLVLYHYITGKCSCRCPYCYYVTGSMLDLNTVEILSIYEQAKDLGYLATVITGGEPFQRPDLPEILEYIHSLDMTVHLMTNGYHLQEQWLSVHKYVDTLIISVDVADDDLDKIRRRPDSFQAIVNGIDFVKKHSSLPIIINSILWKQNKEMILDLATFARDMQAMVNFYPMDAYRMFRNNQKDSKENLALDYSLLSEIFQQIQELKSKKFPILNSDDYIKKFVNYKPAFQCHFQEFFTQIMANGEVVDCSTWGDPLGNVQQTTLEKIVQAKHSQTARKRAHSCNACNRSEVIELSLAYSWHREAIQNMLRWL